jgi:hypothetical protein
MELHGGLGRLQSVDRVEHDRAAAPHPSRGDGRAGEALSQGCRRRRSAHRRGQNQITDALRRKWDGTELFNHGGVLSQLQVDGLRPVMSPVDRGVFPTL